MSNQWRVLDLSHFEGTIHSVRGGIEIEPANGERKSIPVADIAIALIGTRVSLSGAALHRLTAADIPLLLCDWRGIPEAGAYAWTNHGRVGARQRAQIRLSVPRQKNAWGRIVAAKVRGQAATLANIGVHGSGELRALAEQVRSGDPQNIEAQAARLYWRRTMGAGETRSPGDGHLLGWNACLDYSYTILRGHGIRAVLSAGLAPALGVFHHGRSNNFALVDDLIEPFRPCVDEVVFSLPRKASPEDSAVKRLLVAAADQRFSRGGHGVASSLASLAQQFGRYCEGDVDRMSVEAWTGPTTIGFDQQDG